MLTDVTVETGFGFVSNNLEEVDCFEKILSIYKFLVSNFVNCV